MYETCDLLQSFYRILQNEHLLMYYSETLTEMSGAVLQFLKIGFMVEAMEASTLNLVPYPAWFTILISVLQVQKISLHRNIVGKGTMCFTALLDSSGYLEQKSRQVLFKSARRIILGKFCLVLLKSDWRVQQYQHSQRGF